MIPIYPFSGRISRILIPVLSILLCCSVYILPTLGAFHLFDWDEINFAESAREMLISKNYSLVQIGFRPFWEKPPFFIWMQSISMHCFGVNEFAARFPNFLAACFTLISLYFFGARLHSPIFGFLWVTLFFGSYLPNLYFHSGIIDPWYNFFIFLSLYYLWGFFKKTQKSNALWLYLSGFFLGLGILTKGPAALLTYFPTFFLSLFLNRGNVSFSLRLVFNFLLILLITGSSWFIYLFFSNKSWIISEFLNYQWRLFSTADAGHSGPWYYHFAVLLIGCFPASVLAIKGLFGSAKLSDFGRFMLISFWVHLLLFTIVKTKIIHYSSYSYFPLTFIAAEYVQSLIRQNQGLETFKRVLLIVLYIVFGIALLILPFALILFKSEDFVAFFSLNHTLSTIFQREVNWTYLDLLPGFIFIGFGEYGLLKIFSKDYLNGISIFSFCIATTLFVSSFTLVPKIESYTQGTLIDYFGSAMNGRSVRSLGFKSYIDLFYGKPIDGQIGRNKTIECFLTSSEDTVFAISRSAQSDELLIRFPCLKIDSASSGFTFYRCIPGF